MSYSTTLTVYGTPDEDVDRVDLVHDVSVDISLSRGSIPPSGQFGPPEHYDPGDGPEFDIDLITITIGTHAKPVVVEMGVNEFSLMFPQADAIIEAAQEWGDEHEADYTEEPDYDC